MPSACSSSGSVAESTSGLCHTEMCWRAITRRASAWFGIARSMRRRSAPGHSCRRGMLLAAAASALLLLRLPSVMAAQSVDILVADGVGHALANVVLSATPIDMANPPPATVAVGPATIIQRDRQFQPLVSAVQTGTQIVFPNRDRVRHHVYSFSAPKPFELKLYGGSEAAPVRFDKPGTVVIGCNIHDQMLAYVRVLDTPFFALTDAQGKARIELPAGRYRIALWHPDVDLKQAIEQGEYMQDGKQPALLRYTLKAAN